MTNSITGVTLEARQNRERDFDHKGQVNSAQSRSEAIGKRVFTGRLNKNLGAAALVIMGATILLGPVGTAGSGTDAGVGSLDCTSS